MLVDDDVGTGETGFPLSESDRGNSGLLGPALDDAEADAMLMMCVAEPPLGRSTGLVGLASLASLASFDSFDSLGCSSDEAPLPQRYHHEPLTCFLGMQVLTSFSVEQLKLKPAAIEQSAKALPQPLSFMALPNTA